MPIYNYQCKDQGHLFEAIQGVKEEPLKKCKFCDSEVEKIITMPTLLKNAGIYVFDRSTKDDILRSRPSSIKSYKDFGKI